MIQLFKRPKLTGKYLGGVLASGWYTSGPMVRRLEENLEHRFGKCAVVGASATACFQAIIDLLRDEDQGLRYYIREDTWPGMHMVLKRTLGPERFTTKSPDIVVVTDIGGDSHEPLHTAGARAASTLIHDACHSWRLFDYAIITTRFDLMSFYPTKLVPGAEGGVVFCEDPADVEKIRLRLYCGMEPGGAGRGARPAVTGRKANMTDVQAALNLEALQHLAPLQEELATAHARLRSVLEGEGLAVKLQYHPYLLQVRVDNEAIPSKIKMLRRNGIASAWNFRPSNWLTLPMYGSLTNKSMKEIARWVKL